MKAHLKIQCHYPEMLVPHRAHDSDAGMDLTAYAVEQRKPSVFFFDTGISIQISEGYYLEVVPRSSITKTDFVMANSIGIIDPGYRGRIYVPFRYLGPGDALEAANQLILTRIAQLIVRKLESCSIECVASLDDSKRGSGGFGSSGV